jgi:hypothetical protein
MSMTNTTANLVLRITHSFFHSQLNHLDPEVIKLTNLPWTEEEDRKLVLFIKNHGTRWRLMQNTILPNRSEITIKNRWNSSMKRRYSKFLSERWNVPIDKIVLLNGRGLLHPGVDIEQMLQVAQINMAAIHRRSLHLATSKLDLIARNTMPINYEQFSRFDSKEDVMTRIHLAINNEKAGPCFCRILKTSMSDPAGIPTELGFLTIDTCLAGARVHIATTFGVKSFKYSLPQLGILTSKQELDLGSVLPLLTYLNSSEKGPLSLLIVEEK